MIEIYNIFLNSVIGIQQKMNLQISDYFDRLDSGENSMFIYILLS